MTKRRSFTPVRSVNRLTDNARLRDRPLRQQLLDTWYPVLTNAPVLEPNELQVNVTETVLTILRHLPSMKMLKDEMKSKLLHAPIQELDELERLALMTYEAELDTEVTQGPHEAKQRAENLFRTVVQPKRIEFMALANQAAGEGIISEEKLTAFYRCTGSMRLEVECVLNLCDLFRQHWQPIESLSKISLSDIDLATAAAQECLHQLVLADQLAQNQTAPIQIRDRCLSQLLRSYDKVRQAIVYLRWAKHDSDNFCPPLKTMKKSNVSLQLVANTLSAKLRHAIDDRRSQEAHRRFFWYASKSNARALPPSNRLDRESKT